MDVPTVAGRVCLRPKLNPGSPARVILSQVASGPGLSITDCRTVRPACSIYRFMFCESDRR
jgi:hypothetical protein